MLTADVALGRPRHHLRVSCKNIKKENNTNGGGGYLSVILWRFFFFFSECVDDVLKPSHPWRPHKRENVDHTVAAAADVIHMENVCPFELSWRNIRQQIVDRSSLLRKEWEKVYCTTTTTTTKRCTSNEKVALSVIMKKKKMRARSRSHNLFKGSNSVVWTL